MGAKYQLQNDDYNVRQLRKIYDISTKEAPNGFKWWGFKRFLSWSKRY
ncbi:Csa1 family protein [Staphylococcus aureus]